MKISHYFLVCLLLTGLACKSSYEKVRTSADPGLIFQTANNYYEKKDYLKAQALYELILTSFRGQKEAEDIYYKYAYTHYYLSEFDLSSHLFKNFANTFVSSVHKEEADYMSVYSIYKTSANYKLDQSGTEKAIEGFQSFANTYPDSKRVSDCNQYIDELRSKMEKKAFEQGKLYYELRNYQSCVSTLENLLTDYPETKNLREVRYMLVKSSFLLAERSIFDKQKERYISTIEKSHLFLNKFSSGKYAQEVRSISKEALSKSKNPLYDRYKNTSTGNKS